MSLRNRLSLIIVLLTLLAALGFGLLTFRTFVQQQDAQLEELLQQDLVRVAALLDQPTLGASFVGDDVDGFILQVVTPDQEVVMSFGGERLLPSTAELQTVDLSGRRYLVGQTPWGTTGGTIRVAHDIEAALLTRRRLVEGLVVNGSLVIFIATLLGLFTTRRQLAPMQRVAERARVVDPAMPSEIEYGGPADEIGDLASALNTALGAIRSRQGEERAFLLEIAHEIAAPLTLVRYHLAGLADEHPEDERLRAAADAARELLRTSQDLLVLARGELERPLEPEILALGDLLERVRAEYPGVALEIGETSDVVGDPERLMQVARNLVRNAVQASGGAAGVSLHLTQGDGEVVLAVVDEGSGIRAEVLEKIFEHRYSEHRGTGVGLSVARSIVEQHHGTISATSEPGKGSRFEVRLPSVESRVEA